MAFDFSNRDTAEAASRGIPVFLTDPASKSGEPLVDGEGNQPCIVILGGDAPKVRAVTHKALDAYYERSRKGDNVKGRTKRDEEELIQRLAAATVSWVHIALDGKDLPCTEENAKKFYTRFLWVAQQLQNVIDDRAAFFTSGSAS
jgi:hypothetical protein